MEAGRAPASAALEAGYGECVITPPLGVELAGYGFYLERRAVRVIDDLFARCVCVRLGEARAFLVSCDLIGFSVDDADRHRRRIASRWGATPAQVLLACTHTHSGPATKPATGLGAMDPSYVERLPAWIDDAVERAVGDLRPCALRVGEGDVGGIGYNRRGPGAGGADPRLRVARFERADRRIFLLAYACHPVTVGRTGDVTADWPGAVSARFGQQGDCGIVLQGCSGEIDPVAVRQECGHGTPDDVLRTGERLASRAAAIAARADDTVAAGLAASERRVVLPLTVWSGERIGREARAFVERFGAFPGAARFAAEWERLARAAGSRLEARPFLDGVPIQAIGIGSLRILALPGEPFTGIGARVREACPGAWVVGYANGSVGYLPTREAYDDPSDYACWCAPRFTTLVPFDAGLEDILVREGRAALAALEVS